jgi:hypothetical protein
VDAGAWAEAAAEDTGIAKARTVATPARIVLALITLIFFPMFFPFPSRQQYSWWTERQFGVPNRRALITMASAVSFPIQFRFIAGGLRDGLR